MRHYEDFNADEHKFSVGNQPRKSVYRMSKKMHSFKNVETDQDIEKHRHGYKRAADKTSTRAQLRDTQFMVN